MAGRIPVYRRVGDVLPIRPGKADCGVCTSCHRRSALWLPTPGQAGFECFSKGSVHDVKADVSLRRVMKRLRHCGEHLEAKGAPQPDRWCIGLDYGIELHGPVTVGACLVKDMTAQSLAYALVPPRWMDNESGIGNVRSRARVIGMSVRAADDASIVIDGDDGSPWWLSHPADPCPRFGCSGIPCQRLACCSHCAEDRPDSGPVSHCRFPDHHGRQHDAVSRRSGRGPRQIKNIEH
jgi:hypothetical protein